MTYWFDFTNVIFRSEKPVKSLCAVVLYWQSGNRNFNFANIWDYINVANCLNIYGFNNLNVMDKQEGFL